MSKNGKDRRPYLRPVTRITLPEINVKARWILLVVFLLIAASAFAVGVGELVTTQPGWQEITVSSQSRSCADEFQLMYDFSEAGGSATAQNKTLNALYTQATEEIYRLFTPDELEEGVHNIAYLNAHLCEPVTVEPELYEALRLVAEANDRHVFLAPAMVEYDRLFRSGADGEAALYDPTTEPEAGKWVSDVAFFVSNPDHIQLRLEENNQVTLFLSQEYLEFCRENEIEMVLDFGWMVNAFRIDALAQRLTAQGFTNGYLVSRDGFTRNLDCRGTVYSLNLYDAQGVDVYMPAEIRYPGQLSMVSLRSFPLTEQDQWRYYAYADGRIVSCFVDPEDGMSKTAASMLLCYSRELGCGQILLQAVNTYVSDALDPQQLQSLRLAGISSIWSKEQTICYNDPSLEISLLPESGPGYRLACQN